METPARSGAGDVRGRTIVGFRDLPRPFVCGVLIDDPTPEGVLRTMKLAEYEGADAFDLEVQGLASEYHTVLPGAINAIRRYSHPGARRQSLARLRSGGRSERGSGASQNTGSATHAERHQQAR